MGNYLSNQVIPENMNSNKCFHCCNKVDPLCKVECIKCYTILHVKCYDEINTEGKNYCVCPQCNQVGTMGTGF
jgi:hypothetical protein